MDFFQSLLRPWRLRQLRAKVGKFYSQPKDSTLTPAEVIYRADSLSRFTHQKDIEVVALANFWMGHLYLLALSLIPSTNLSSKYRGWYVVALSHLKMSYSQTKDPFQARRARLLMGVALQNYGSKPAALPHFQEFLRLYSTFPLTASATKQQIFEDCTGILVCNQALSSKASIAS